MEAKSMLLIGNTPHDVKFIIKTFGNNSDENSLSVVDTCVQARAFLEKTGKYKEAPRPDVVFMGAHIKKEDREKFMQYIKQNTDSRIRCVRVLKLAAR